MLALRARGLGSVLITGHIEHCEQEVAKILDLPADITQAALLPVAYFTGADFKPAQRIPPNSVRIGIGGENGGWASAPSCL